MRTAPVRIPDIYQINIRVVRRRLCIQRKRALIKITRVCTEAVVLTTIIQGKLIANKCTRYSHNKYIQSHTLSLHRKSHIPNIATTFTISVLCTKFIIFSLICLHSSHHLNVKYQFRYILYQFSYFNCGWFHIVVYAVFGLYKLINQHHLTHNYC